MKRNYVRNAAILTVSNFALRLAGMGFRIYLVHVLGETGVGLYELILAFYAVFITLATSGVSVASTRLITEEFSRKNGSGKSMLRLLAGTALLLGLAAAAAQWLLAGAAARYWIGDTRAADAIRAAAFGLPCMALSAVLRGFFLARRDVKPNVCSQMIEQGVRIVCVALLLARTEGEGLAVRCAVVMAGTALSEAVSTGIMLAFYSAARNAAYSAESNHGEKAAFSRVWVILWPVEGSRCLSSGLHTAENMLVPACLALFLADAGGRDAALAQYGVLKGMTLPLLFFPFGLLGALATLLMPEITEAHICGRTQQLQHLLDRMLTLTMYASVLAGALFFFWGGDLSELLYQNAEAGFYLSVLAPVMPMMYLESMLDGALKGLGEQKAGFTYAVWDSVLRIAGVIALLPRFGMKSFLFVMICSNLFTCLMNFRRLITVAQMKVRILGWFGAPCAAAVPAALAGHEAARLLPLASEWLRLLCGGGITMVLFLAVSSLLGLPEMLHTSGKGAGKK